MNKIKYVIALMVMILTTSCLKMGLDELPAYENAEILSMKFEYRWYNEAVGLGNMVVVPLTVRNLQINSEAATITLDISVPAVSTTLPAEQREKVELNNIVGYCDISTAAVIKPLEGAPTLGIFGDFSKKDLKYEVKAANGAKKVWSVTVNSFTK
ncbi:MAG: DUF5018-related domain-containing protein [Bacteroidales bacterium]